MAAFLPWWSESETLGEQTWAQSYSPISGITGTCAPNCQTIFTYPDGPIYGTRSFASVEMNRTAGLYETSLGLAFAGAGIAVLCLLAWVLPRRGPASPRVRLLRRVLPILSPISVAVGAALLPIFQPSTVSADLASWFYVTSSISPGDPWVPSPSPETSFWGSCVRGPYNGLCESGATASWGPGVGWDLLLAALGLMFVSMLLFSRRPSPRYGFLPLQELEAPSPRGPSERHPRLPILVFALFFAATLLFAGTALSVAASGGSLAPIAPGPVGPPWPVLETTPSTYDPAQALDIWFFPDGQTWTYARGDWSDITSTAGVPLGMGANVDMAYDAQDGYVLIYGGASGPYDDLPLSETWALEGGRWVNLTGGLALSPPARLGGLLTYDSEDHEVLLFGGTGSGFGFGLNDTWTFSGGQWRNVTVNGPPPFHGTLENSLENGFVDDPAQGYVLFDDAFTFGPQDTNLWTFHAGVWSNLPQSDPPSPTLELFSAFTYDSTAGFVMAEAFCGSTVAEVCPHESGTFEFTGTGWKDITPPLAPPSRDSDSWVNDPSDGGVMIVGGCCWADPSGLSTIWGDLWIYAGGSWTEEHPWGGAPPPLEDNDGFWLGIVPLMATSMFVAATRWHAPRPS